MWVHLKLSAMTVLLTGLIWVYADQAVKETDTLVLAVSLRAGEDLIPTILDPAGGNFSVKVSGSAKDVSQARKDVQAGLLRTLTVPLADLESGTHAVDLGEQLLESNLLSERRLTVLSVSPPELLIDVDRWEHREVKLTPITPVGTLFVDQPTFDPPTVTVTYPASRELDLQLDTGLPIAIGEYIQGKPAGEKLAIPVVMPSVVGSPEVQITCQPSEVRLRLMLRTSLIEQDLEDSVSIQVLATPKLFGQYEIEFRRAAFVRPRLKGSREALTALTASQVSAFVFLSSDEVAESLADPDKWLALPVEYRFPSKDLSVVGPPETVEIRIKPSM